MQVAPPNEDTSTMKMYVLINRDILSLVQCGVQAGHSIHSYCLKHPDKCKEWNDNHKTLIYLEAKEGDIYAKMNECHMKGITFTHFDEPDIGNRLTACCFEPMQSDKGKILFGGFKLLS
jgi:hypothetical protein